MIREEQNQDEIIQLIEAEHLVDKYHSTLQTVRQEIEELNQKGEEHSLGGEENKMSPFFKKLNQRYWNNIHLLEGTLKKAIAMSRSIIKREADLKSLQASMDLSTHESNYKIEALTDQISFLVEKVAKSDQQGERLSIQLLDLQQKMHNMDKFYENQRKDIVSGYIEERTTRKKGQEYLVSQLKESNESLNKLLNLTKKEHSERQQTMVELRQKVEHLTKQLSKLEGKFEYQMQKKEQIGNQLIDKLSVIQNLESQIQELRDVLRNPFERLQPNDQQFDYQYVDEPLSAQVDQIPRKQSRQSEKIVRFSQDAHEYKNDKVDYSDITGSFIHKLSQMGVKLDSVPDSNQCQDHDGLKPSPDRHSFEKNKIIQIDRGSYEIVEQEKTKDSKNENGQHEDKSTDKFMVSRKLSIRSTVKVQVNRKSSWNNVDEQKSSSVLQRRKSQHKKSVQLIHSQMSQTQPIPRANIPKKAPTPLDPYYSHFILTSQAVKIRQDCEDLLNIDVKPFYREIIQLRIPMHLWDQWLRNKLKEIIKENQAVN